MWVWKKIKILYVNFERGYLVFRFINHMYDIFLFLQQDNFDTSTFTAKLLQVFMTLALRFITNDTDPAMIL